MKKIITLFILSVVLLPTTMYAQIDEVTAPFYFEENFDYTPGINLAQNEVTAQKGWKAWAKGTVSNLSLKIEVVTPVD